MAGIKKADVVEYPRVFDHVGLLMNEPPGPDPNRICRFALY